MLAAFCYDTAMQNSGLKRAIIQDWPSVAVIILTTSLQIFLITRPLGFLLANLLPDDAFYYFQIARNIIAGAGSTFDGFNLTNGYHPLWMLILLPVYAVTSVGGTHDITPIYVALGISVLLNTCTAILICNLLGKIAASPYVRGFALSIWALNPFVIYESLNGLETSLSLFLLVSFITAALRYHRSGNSLEGVLVGVLAGLLILARLDMVCFVLAYAVWVLFQKGIHKGIMYGIPAAVPAAGIVLLWLAYNILTFGMILTSASAGSSLVNHTLVTQDNGTGMLVQLRAVAYMLVTYGSAIFVRTGAAWLVFVLIGIGVAGIFQGAKDSFKEKSAISLYAALFGGLLLLFFLNAGLRFTGRTWYFISADLFLAFLAAYVLSMPFVRQTRVNLIIFLLSIATAASFFISWKTDLYDNMKIQTGMYQMAELLNERFDPSTRVGVFNAGIVGYFSDIHVINLDGLVNNSAHDAMRTHTLWAYIESEHLTYIGDFPLYITYRYRSFFGVSNPLTKLEPVATITTPGGSRGDQLVLYRFKSAGE